MNLPNYDKDDLLVRLLLHARTIEKRVEELQENLGKTQDSPSVEASVGAYRLGLENLYRTFPEIKQARKAIDITHFYRIHIHGSRIEHACKALGITTTEELLAARENNLFQCRNFGRGTYGALQKEFIRLGLASE